MYYAQWFVKEAGKVGPWMEIQTSIKLFKSSYVYIKKYETDYGAAVKALCDCIEKVSCTHNSR